MRSVDAMGDRRAARPGTIAVLDELLLHAANSLKSNRDLVCKREFFVGESLFRAVSFRCRSTRAIAEFSLLRVCRSYGLLRALPELTPEDSGETQAKTPNGPGIVA